VTRPEPLDWKIEGAGNSTLSFRAVASDGSGLRSSPPYLNISVDYERDTMYGGNYLNAGHITLNGDAAVKFARELMFGQATAEGTFWRLVYDNTERFQFVLYGKNNPHRALRRFSIGLLSSVTHNASQMLDVLRWSPTPATAPSPPAQPKIVGVEVVKRPQTEPVMVSVRVACGHCGLTVDEMQALIAQRDNHTALEKENAELQEENAKLRAMVRFYKQYAPA
jgi:hypothetical protein